MEIYVNIKSIGRKKFGLHKVPYNVTDNITTLLELITEIVKNEVEKYNSKTAEVKLLPFLTDFEIESKKQTGKVGFGSIYSDKTADLNKAVETAVVGFQDGLYRVILGDEEIKDLDSGVSLKEGDVLTFIRLTFLSGSIFI